jgi:DNA polymerase-3 subunit gamma/tau
MLGTVDRTQVTAMLDALAAGDGARLLQVVATLADFSPDWSGVLDALAEALHRIQVQQLVPGAAAPGDGVDALAFASRLRPEVVQLWYQMALGGRRDLHLAPSPRAGFEMTVLRMLAFRPAGAVPAVPEGEGPGTGAVSSSAGGSAPAVSAAAVAAPAQPVATAPVAEPVPADAPPKREDVVPLAPRAPQADATSLSPAPAAEPVQAREDDDLPPWMEETAAAQAHHEVADAMPPAPRQAPPSPFRAEGIAIAPPPPATTAAGAAPRALENAEQWLDLVAASGLSGPSRELAAGFRIPAVRALAGRAGADPGAGAGQCAEDRDRDRQRAGRNPARARRPPARRATECGRSRFHGRPPGAAPACAGCPGRARFHPSL